jgi:hypothetical protein
MATPIPIREDIPAAELRRLARQETNGRAACRLIAFANMLHGAPSWLRIFLPYDLRLPRPRR